MAKINFFLLEELVAEIMSELEQKNRASATIVSVGLYIDGLLLLNKLIYRSLFRMHTLSFNTYTYNIYTYIRTISYVLAMTTSTQWRYGTCSISIQTNDEVYDDP